MPATSPQPIRVRRVTRRLRPSGPSSGPFLGPVCPDAAIPRGDGSPIGPPGRRWDGFCRALAPGHLCGRSRGMELLPFGVGMLLRCGGPDRCVWACAVAKAPHGHVCTAMVSSASFSLDRAYSIPWQGPLPFRWLGAAGSSRLLAQVQHSILGPSLRKETNEVWLCSSHAKCALE